MLLDLSHPVQAISLLPGLIKIPYWHNIVESYKTIGFFLSGLMHSGKEIHVHSNVDSGMILHFIGRCNEIDRIPGSKKLKDLLKVNISLSI